MMVVVYLDPPNVPLFVTLWSLLDGILGCLKGQLGGAGSQWYTAPMVDSTPTVHRPPSTSKRGSKRR